MKRQPMRDDLSRLTTFELTDRRARRRALVSFILIVGCIAIAFMALGAWVS